MAKEEPAIVTTGRNFIIYFSPQEFLGSLRRAFKIRKTKILVFNSDHKRQKFLAACIAWAVDKGLLYNDRNQDEYEQVISTFRLTKKGEKRILGR